MDEMEFAEVPDDCKIATPAPTEMTIVEQERRDVVENEIDANLAKGRAAYLAVGKGLAEILECRLYREDYPSFEEYCQDFWGISDSLAYKWAAAWRVAQNLADDVADMPILAWNMLDGFNPSHARKLSRLPPEQQVEAWSRAKEIQETPTAKVIGQVVEQFQDEFAAVDDMTKDEELDYLQRAEKAVGDAYEASKRFGKRLWLEKQIRKIDNYCGEVLPELREPLDKIRQICAAIEPPETQAPGTA